MRFKSLLFISSIFILAAPAFSQKSTLYPDGYTNNYLQQKDRSATIGLSLYATGVAVQYGAVLPLSIVGGDESRERGVRLLNFGAVGLKTTGPLVAGIAAYRAQRQFESEYGELPYEKEFHWGYYGSGCAFAVMGMIVHGSVGISDERKAIFGITSTAIAEVLLGMHTVKAKKTTSTLEKSSQEKSNPVSFSVTPILHWEYQGIQIGLHF